MKINYSDNKIENLDTKVRAVLGVPELILTKDIIFSPVFLLKTDRYINSKIKDYEDLEKNLIEVAWIYYLCYLLCPGMYARLPKQMENTNTKTILQSMDWGKIALDMLENCNSALDEAIEENNEVDYLVTVATLSDEASYPNTLV